MGPIFTPPSLRDAEDGTQGTFVVPGTQGGMNAAGGASVDPETGILYVASIKGHNIISLVNEPETANMRFIGFGAPRGIRGPQGLPLLKPPYGRIVAIDLNTGEHLWNIPNDDTPEQIANHRALQGVDLPRTGKPAHASLLVTKTVVFGGEGSTGDPIFRAYDKQTGEILAEVELPATTNATPMTYMHDGRQFIVAAIGAAPSHPAELVALALPD